MKKDSALLLESGEIFYGTNFGSKGTVFGEIVFNTAMTGYQEILTDPSYKGQIITMTCPEIGNYGIDENVNQSNEVHASGFVVRNYSDYYGGKEGIENIDCFLKRHKVVCISGIDTRKITRIIREGGAKKAVISSEYLEKDVLMKQLKSFESNKQVVEEVSTKNIYNFVERDGVFSRGNVSFKVAVIDFGVKVNILKSLHQRGAQVKVFPFNSDLVKILKEFQPNGILLSNGPGDPRVLKEVVNNIKKVIGKVPIFGICLGHQLLSLAYGYTIEKLKFGHRGANHPIKNFLNKRIDITVQNHGYVVKEEKLLSKKKKEFFYYNLNDNTIAGIQAIEKDYCFSVQSHPEASPGPHDSFYLFDTFFNLMNRFKLEKSK